MPPRPSHVARSEAADALGRVAPLVARWIERLLAAVDPPLTPAQHQALHVVADGGATGADLARAAAVSPAAVSQLVVGLEGAGLIRRDRGADDRRRQVLALTDGGAQALASADAVLRDRIGTLLADLPPPEVDALGRSLRLLLATLSGSPPPRRPPRPPGPPPPR